MINNVTNRDRAAELQQVEPPKPPPPPPAPAPVAGHTTVDQFAGAAGANGPELAPDATGAPEATGKAANDAALQGLSPADKARYDEIVAAGGPGAAAAQKLAAEGRFAEYAKVEATIEGVGAPLEKQDLRRALAAGRLEGGVLESLGQMTGGGTTAQGYSRNQVLCQLAQDLGRPEQLFQKGDQRDCGGMAAEYMMATSNPAAFTKSVVELAEKGTTQLGGMTLVAPPEDAADARGPTQRVFAGAFVKTAQGLAPMNEAVRNGIGGLNASQMAAGVGSMTGVERDALFMAEPKKGQGSQADALATQAAAEQVLREHAAAGQAVMANRSDGHWMAVTGIEGTGPDAKVNFVDVNGGQLSCKLSDFVKDLDSLVFSKGVSAPGTLGDPSWGDDGGGGSQGATTNGGDDLRRG